MTADSSNATSPLIENLQLRKMEAELRAEIAGSEAKLAKLEIDTSKAPENKVTTEGDPPTESIVLAYGTLCKAADHIAEEFNRVGSGYDRIVVLNGDFQKAVLELSISKTNIKSLIEYFDSAVDKFEKILEPTIKEESALSAVPVAGAVINSALELSSLLRVERLFKYSKLDIDNEAVISAVANALLKNNIEIYDPLKVLAPTTIVEDKNSISIDLASLRNQNRRLLALKDRIGTERSTSSKADEVRLKVLEAAFAEVTNAIEEIEASIALFVKPDTITGITAFARLLETEQLAGPLEKAAFLSVKLVSLVGATRTKRRFFSSSLAFSGGCVVSFTLSDMSGKIFAAEVIPAYSGFMDADKLPQFDGLLIPSGN